LFAEDAVKSTDPIAFSEAAHLPQKKIFKPVVRIATILFSSGRETIGLAVKFGVWMIRGSK